MVRYCSPQCQRGAWPRHKRSCASAGKAREEMNLPENHDKKVSFDSTTKWINLWRDELTVIGLGAMDLSSHPDKLGTHV